MPFPGRKGSDVSKIRKNQETKQLASPIFIYSQGVPLAKICESRDISTTCTLSLTLNTYCMVDTQRVKVSKSFFSVFPAGIYMFKVNKDILAEEYDLNHLLLDSHKLFKLRTLVQGKVLAFRNLSSHTQQAFTYSIQQ